MKKIGFIINPVAGLGGKAGFKGSDRKENLEKALELGYEKEAEKRAKLCLESVAPEEAADLDYQFFTAGGEMGENLLRELGIPCTDVDVSGEKCQSKVAWTGTREERFIADESGTGEQKEKQLSCYTSEDTRACVRIFSEIPVDLILFCGGDGTARDICASNTEGLPVLGIPAGVKMYSGCFAVSPRAAGNLLREYGKAHSIRIEPREVMDISEEVLGTRGNSPKLYGYLPTIGEGMKLQGAKSVCTAAFEETDILAEHIVRTMEADTLYLIGPGSTTFCIKEKLSIDGTLLGVDAVKNGRLIKKDADEKTIFHLVKGEARTEIIVTCIGGNGFVFGRGNQQISARVIRTVGKANIKLAVTKSKLASLWQKPMLLDTGNSETDRYLSGYYRIEFSDKESAVYKLAGCE